MSADSWKPYWRYCTQTHQRGCQTAQRAARAGVVDWLLASIAAAWYEQVRTGQISVFLFMQAEAELEANKNVIRDSKLAKHREQLLSFSSLDPGLVLMSVPEGHSASAKVTHPSAKYLVEPSAECLSTGTQQTRWENQYMSCGMSALMCDHMAAGDSVHQGRSNC